MIAQSAGNYDMDACGVAFGYGNTAGSNDGILVVSGTDNYDQRYQQTPNPSPYYNTEKRANFGHCVETWAPGRSMTTTTGNGSIITATGTSFAAPVVAALAGRYGNATTRPIEREAYIKEAADWTGHYDGSSFNLPIYRAKYSPPYWHNIPKRLPVTGVYSISSTTNLNKLVDEKFYDGIDWNAGGGWGSIVIDLGSAKNLTGVRVMIRSSANGGTLNFAVHGGNTINVTAPGVATIPNNPIAYQGSNDQFDLVPYYIPISGNYRYVMLEASNAASWLSYSEVEVYGR